MTADTNPAWNLRVAICVPGERWLAGFGQCVANVVRTFCEARYEGGTKTCEVFGVSGSILPDVRMRCVAEAYKWGATHVLFLDDDMIVPWDTVGALLRHNVSIVAANYVRRDETGTPTAFGLDGQPLHTPEGAEGLVEVAHAGMGCMLVDMRVFDSLDLPYFMFEPTADNAGTIGEDVYFCRKARAAGFPVYVDQRLSRKVGHIGQFVFTHALADAARATATPTREAA
jgi:hypothetical protein